MNILFEITIQINLFPFYNYQSLGLVLSIVHVEPFSQIIQCQRVQ